MDRPARGRLSGVQGSADGAGLDSEVRRAMWDVRVVSGVYVGLPTCKGSGSPVVASICDAGLLQASLSLCRVLSAEMRPPRCADLTGFVIAPLHPASAARLRNSIAKCLSLICLMLPTRMRHTGGRVWGARVVRPLLRVIALLNRRSGARLIPVGLEGLDTPSSGEGQAPPVPARYVRVATEISRILAGRLLSISELVALLEAIGVEADLAAVTVAVDALSMLGLLQMLPAVERGAVGRAHCTRCGSTSVVAHTGPCPRCGYPCLRCPCCSSLGVMTACTWLLHAPVARCAQSQPDRAPVVTLDIPFPLTEVQRRASRRVRAFVEGRGQGEFLVWAACGAGKTEVACAAIASELNRGGTVLYVVPRRTVASDLYSRLSRLFPGTEISLRTGDRQLGPPLARFAVCTSHQTLRLRHWADLVVFDEVDAFPCEPGGFLEWAVKRSCRPGGKLVYLTATPDATMFERVRARKLPFCLISTRHHGRPVPVPEIVGVRPRLGGSRDSHRMCHTLTGSHRGGAGDSPCVVNRLRLGDRYPFSEPELCLLCLAARDLSPALVFVPTIELVEEARAALDGVLHECFAGARFGYCHSGLQRNDEVVDELRQGRLTSVVTTTVLERGITISGVNVIVIRADSPVFDASSLVQMAGRAGRTADCPTGRVLFAVASVTPDVKRAVDMIAFMNARLGK